MSFTHVHQTAMAQQRNRGRCLHYNNGARCDAIISAHSIQKGGQLNLILEQGHVYQLSADLTTLKSTGGKPQLKKVGINKVSTFRGMCKYHDKRLFAPIDDRPLAFDHEQIALYAYRSVCREAISRSFDSSFFGRAPLARYRHQGCFSLIMTFLAASFRIWGQRPRRSTY